MPTPHIVIVGGGAAGMFAAVNCAEMCPSCRVTVLEKGKRLLEKVKISGGGRCNVTHACFDVAELVKNYPRGQRELIAPFQHFQPRDTIAWFAQRGVRLKTEVDGRMFPTTDDSQTIIDCLVGAAQRAGVILRTQTALHAITPPTATHPTWQLSIGNPPATTTLTADIVLMATGSSTSSWQQIASLGHTIAPPIPSLFTLQIKDPRLTELAGVSVGQVELRLPDTKVKTQGALLVTHWGLSGPAVLRLSAFGAEYLHQKNYTTALIVNFLPHLSPTQLLADLQHLRTTQPKKNIAANTYQALPLRLWQRIVAYCGIADSTKWADLSNKALQHLSVQLQQSSLPISGKSTFKEEFVSCGGVLLKELNFKTMESRVMPKLFLAGEVLHIDAVTGGFNFQAAWTTAYIAATAIQQKLNNIPAIP